MRFRKNFQTYEYCFFNFSQIISKANKKWKKKYEKYKEQRVNSSRFPPMNQVFSKYVIALKSRRQCTLSFDFIFNKKLFITFIEYPCKLCKLCKLFELHKMQCLKSEKKYPPKIGVNYHIIYHIISIADTSWHIDLIYRLWNNSISYQSSNSKMLKKMI